MTQHGCDSHMEDPLAHLMLSVDGQRASYLALHDLAHEVCDGRWVVTGGGGYALVDVVPRAWTHLLAIVAGRPIDPATETPQAWRDHVTATLGRRAPSRMTDGRTPLWRDWPRATTPTPGSTAPSRRPATRSSPRTASTRADGLASERQPCDSSDWFRQRKPTRRVSQVSLVKPFPTSHNRRYFHRARDVESPVGKPVASPQESAVPHARMTPQPGDISEVKFLTVAEVAAMMRVSKMTVYRLVHNGELPAVRVGRSFRVTEDDVNEYLRKCFYQTG